MIDAMIHGRLVRCVEQDNLLVGRIVHSNDEPVQFTARRGFVKAALAALPIGMPVAVAGELSSSIKHDKDGRAFVLNEICITAVLTAQPTSALRSLFQLKAKP